jgi:hypothetical protein
MVESVNRQLGRSRANLTPADESRNPKEPAPVPTTKPFFNLDAPSNINQ